MIYSKRFTNTTITLQGTRWCPHFEKATRSLIAGYSVLVTHFQHVAEAAPGQATAEVKGRAQFVAQKLQDFRVLRLIFLMQDILKVTSTLSLRFQTDGNTCLDTQDALDTACIRLTELSQGPGENYQQFLYAVDNNSYQGVELTHCDQMQQNYQHMAAICETVRDYVSAKLDSRADITMPMLKTARVPDTRDWPATREQLPGYGNDQLHVLVDHFRPLLHRLNVDEDLIMAEWTQVKANLGNRLLRHPRPNPVPRVNDLFLTHGQRLPNFLKIAKIILCLPMSSAICERGFSCVSRIKSHWRSSLTTQQLNNLLIVSIEGPSLDDYNSEIALHRWWTHGQRQRHPQFAQAELNHDDDEGNEERLLQFLLENQNWV